MSVRTVSWSKEALQILGRCDESAFSTIFY